MGRYILKRILLMIPVIIGVSFFIFASMNAAQGDYVDTLETGDMTHEQVEELRASYGLDKPLLERYVVYMWNLLHGDLGTSYRSHESVFKTFMSKIGNTAVLAVASTLVGVVFSLPLGIYAAQHRSGLSDNIASVLAVLGLSIPNFWLGLELIIIFSLTLHWFPSGGNDPLLLCIVLPAVTIGTERMANLTRTTRSAMLDALNQDYLRTARAKGLSEKVVVYKHALKNASIPILNIAMGQFAASFGGAALTETVFGWPGVGKVIVEAVRARDVPLACGCIILKCIIIGILELATDLLYVAVDPRLRTHYASAKRGRRRSLWPQKAES